jgi:type IX secretion system PorP/SprF family membrane protein
MRYLLILVVLVYGFVANAQYSRQYSQYMFNGLAINPAYAGVRECLSVTAIHSSQWVGFEGAPTTQSVTAHTPFRKNSGLGLSFFNDRIAIQNQTGLYLTYAYHLKLNRKSKLSFGVNGGASFFQIRDNDVITIDKDVAFSTQRQTYSAPNIGAGLFYYRENFYAGLSIPSIFSSEYSNIKEKNYFSLRSNSLVIIQTSGAVVKISDNFDWKPSYLIKLIPSISSDLDLNSNFYFRKKVNFGVSYRVKKSLVAMVGCTIQDKFDIGYSYGYPLSALSSYNSGSHEIMLRYEFKEVISTVNPRLY